MGTMFDDAIHSISDLRSKDGKILVITLQNGEPWNSALRYQNPEVNLDLNKE